MSASLLIVFERAPRPTSEPQPVETQSIAIARGPQSRVPRWANQVEMALEKSGERLPDALVSSLAPDRQTGDPIRLHVDPVSTSSLGAAGYAFGRHIVVGDRQDARPDTAAGRRLLAHELSHTTEANDANGPPIRLSDRSDATEVRARSVASGTRPGLPVMGRVPPGTVCRFGSDEHKALGDVAFAGASSDIDIGTAGAHDYLSSGDVVALVGDYFASTADLRALARTDAGRDQIRWTRWWAIDQFHGVAEPAIPEADKQASRDRYFTLAAHNVSHFGGGGTARSTYEDAHEDALRTAFLAGYHQIPSVATLDLSPALTEEAGAQHFLSDMFAAGHVRTERAAIKTWYDAHVPNTRNLFVSWMAHEMEVFLTGEHPIADFFGQVPDEASLVRTINQIGGTLLDAFSLGDIVALGLHDADNAGLDVVSDSDPTGHLTMGGYAWRDIGDSHLGTSPATAPGSTPAALRTREMALAAMRASIAEVRAVAAAGLRQRPRPVYSPGPSPQADASTLADAEIAALRPFQALQYVPRVDPSSTTNPSFAWQWGRLNTPAFVAVDDAVKHDVSDQLAERAAAQPDPNRRAALQHVVDILRRDGIHAVERAIGRPAR